MGTSKGYELPTTPQWGKLKNDVTRQSGIGAVSPNVAKGLFRTYIRTAFGSSGGNGSGGSGGGHAGGGGGGKTGWGGGSKSATSTGQRLAGFASAVATRGVDAALHDLGLSNLVGKSAQEVIFALVDFLTDPGTTFDQVDVRGALDDLWEKLFGKAPSFDEVRSILEENLQVSKIGTLLFDFFSHYFYRSFCRSFHERLKTRRGENRTEGFFTSIKEFVSSALERVMNL